MQRCCEQQLHLLHPNKRNCSRQKRHGNFATGRNSALKNEQMAILASMNCGGVTYRSRERMHSSWHAEGNPSYFPRRKLFNGSYHCVSFDALNFQRCLRIIVLVLAVLVFPIASQTTVKADCPGGCFCVVGEYNSYLMDSLINDGRLITAWDRLRTYMDGTKVTGALFCRNSARFAVPQGLSATADALFLDGNNIDSIEAGDFTETSGSVPTTASSTVALILSNNRIKSIADGAFHFLPMLRLLILRNNKLRDSQWILSGSTAFSQLKELDLSLNTLQRFGTRDFGRLPLLQRLDLSGNEIETVEQEVVRNFPNLEHLDLSDNLITQRSLVSSNTLTSSVRYLSLAGNMLGDFWAARVAEFFKKFSRLETLNLARNLVTPRKVPAKAFAGLYSLKTLNVSGCGIRTLHQGWLNGGVEKSLEILDLSHNLLPAITAHDMSAVFTVNESVALQASAFPDIAEVPEENVETHWLRPLQRLTALYLNGNCMLQQIQDNAFSFVPNLKYLFLQNCAIRRLNIVSTSYRFGQQPVATSFPALTHIWIYGNPISCDCYVRFLKEWVAVAPTATQNQAPGGRFVDVPKYTVGSETKSLEVDSAICVSPPGLAGVTVEAAPLHAMSCQEEPYTILIAVLIGPLMFVGSVVLTLLCGSLHVFITRARKGVVLSYHAREELMRNPRTRSRQRNHQHTPILSGIGWSRPSSRVDLSTVGRGAGRFRHTNLVLGQLEDQRRQQRAREARPHHLSPVMALSHSTTSLNVDGHHRLSAGYCSGTETVSAAPRRLAAPTLVVSAFDADDESRHSKGVRCGGGGGVSDADSVLGKESVRTRSACSDFPFIDEREHRHSFFSDQSDAEKQPLKTASSNGASDSDGSTTYGVREASNLRQRKESFASSNGSHGSTHTIPGIVAT